MIPYIRILRWHLSIPRHASLLQWLQASWNSPLPPSEMLFLCLPYHFVLCTSYFAAQPSASFSQCYPLYQTKLVDQVSDFPFDCVWTWLLCVWGAGHCAAIQRLSTKLSTGVMPWIHIRVSLLCSALPVLPKLPSSAVPGWLCTGRSRFVHAAVCCVQA